MSDLETSRWDVSQRKPLQLFTRSGQIDLVKGTDHLRFHHFFSENHADHLSLLLLC